MKFTAEQSRNAKAAHLEAQRLPLKEGSQREGEASEVEVGLASLALWRRSRCGCTSSGLQLLLAGYSAALAGLATDRGPLGCPGLEGTGRSENYMAGMRTATSPSWLHPAGSRGRLVHQLRG